METVNWRIMVHTTFNRSEAGRTLRAIVSGEDARMAGTRAAQAAGSRAR